MTSQILTHPKELNDHARRVSKCTFDSYVPRSSREKVLHAGQGRTQPFPQSPRRTHDEREQFPFGCTLVSSRQRNPVHELPSVGAHRRVHHHHSVPARSHLHALETYPYLANRHPQESHHHAPSRLLVCVRHSHLGTRVLDLKVAI